MKITMKILKNLIKEIISEAATKRPRRPRRPNVKTQQVYQLTFSLENSDRRKEYATSNTSDTIVFHADDPRHAREVAVWSLIQDGHASTASQANAMIINVAIVPEDF